MRHIGIAACAFLLCTGILQVHGAMAATCGDGIVGPSEECDPGGGLYRQGNPNSTPCDGGGGDGVPGSECFFALTCCKFNCQFANPGPCFDGNTCTIVDQCNNTGLCNQGTPAPNSTSCGDPTATECNLADTCNGAGACVANLKPVGAACGGPPPGGECATDDLCNGAGACVAQTVPAGTPAPTQCADSDPCTADQCNGSGGCQHPGAPAGTACGSPGSTQCDLADTCNGSGSCLPNNRPNGFACSDGLFCTATDTCQAGACAGSGNPCGGNPVCQNVCNEVTHGCIAPAGRSCDDGNDCDGVDTCNGSGSCIPGAPLSDGSSCRDTDSPCTTADTCANQVCESGPAPFVAERRAKLGKSSTVNGNLESWGENGQVAMGRGAYMPDATSIGADKVRLANGVSVFNVAANALNARGTIRGTTTAWPGPPGDFCSVAEFTCGGPDVVLTAGEQKTITESDYGNILLIDGAILTLAPGRYTACSISAGRATKVIFGAGGTSELSVSGDVRISNGSFLGSADGTPWPVLRVSGRKVIFGRDVEIFAHIIAPDGKIRVGVGGMYDGTMCARDLRGATQVVWSCTDPGS